MYHDEWLQWIKYFEENPPGWEEDYRTGMLIQTIQGSVGAEPRPMEEMFPTLRAVFKSRDRIADANRGAMPSGRFLAMMESAKSSDESGWSFSKLLEQSKE